MENNKCIRVFADINQINGCKERIKGVESPIQKMSNILSVAGNDVRLKILLLLYEEQKLCVCDLSDILNMKIPAISQHLRKIKDSGIIGKQRAGSTIYYFLSAEYKKLFKPLFKIINSKKVLAGII